MWTKSLEEEVQSLHDEGLARLDAGDLDAARAIGERLVSMHWSGGFEVIALAERAAGRIESALAALDRGCEAAPGAWSLHLLRGNLLDAAGRRSESFAAYERALGCEGASVPTIRYNRAVAALAAGEAGDALADAEAVLEAAAPELVRPALGIALDALAKLGRADHGVSLVRSLTAELDLAADGDARALLALALLRAGASEARETAREAIELGSLDPAIVEVLAATAEGPAEASRYRVILEGDAHDAERPAVTGWVRVHDVVATSDGEAEALARALLPSRERDDARLPSSELEGSADGPPRVLGASGRIFFGE